PLSHRVGPCSWRAGAVGLGVSELSVARDPASAHAFGCAVAGHHRGADRALAVQIRHSLDGFEFLRFSHRRYRYRLISARDHAGTARHGAGRGNLHPTAVVRDLAYRLVPHPSVDRNTRHDLMPRYARGDVNGSAAGDL